MKQLIDLNGDAKNFELQFECRSVNGEPFDALVVNQATLDAGEELNYEHAANGFISGNVRADKNVYQNWQLLMKTNKPCDVMVKTHVQPLPDFIAPPQEARPPQPQPQPPPKKKESKIPWKIIIIAIILIAGFALLYYLYTLPKPEKNGSDEMSFTETIPPPPMDSSPPPLTKTASSPVPAPVEVPVKSPSAGRPNDIFKQLKKLPLN